MSIANTRKLQHLCVALQDGATVDRGVKIREEATQLLLVPALGP